MSLVNFQVGATGSRHTSSLVWLRCARVFSRVVLDCRQVLCFILSPSLVIIIITITIIIIIAVLVVVLSLEKH